MPADPNRARNPGTFTLPRVLTLLGAVTVVFAGLPVTAGAAQETGQHAAAPQMVIEEIQGVLTADDRLTIAGQLQGGDATVTDARVLVTVHQRTDERWRYQQAVDENVVGNVLHSFAADFRVLEADSSTAVSLTQDVGELGVTIPDSQPGVHPIRVQVLVGGELVDEQMTSIVLVPDRDLVPLAFGLLVPVQQRPPYNGQGHIADPGFLAALEADGNLGMLTQDLRRAEGLPFTLAVDGLTVRVLQSMAEGFTDATGDTAEMRGSEAPHARQADAAFHTLREAADHDHVEVTAMPYASADLVALTRGGLAAEAERQITEGRSLAASALNTQVRPDVLVPTDGLNDDTFRAVASTGVDTLVLDEVYLQSTDPGNISPAAVRDADGFTALVPDPWLAEAAHRWEDRSPAVAAQRLIGELATIHLERPSTAGRGVLMSAGTSSGQVPGGLLPAIAQQVSDASFLEPVTLTDLAETMPAEQPAALAYPGEHRTAELPAEYTEHLASTRAQLGALAGTLVADPVTPSRFDRLVLQAASTHYRGTRLDAGRELLSAIDQAVTTTSASVSILDSEPITLTATEDEIPVAIRSDADIPLQVQVSVIGSRFQVMDDPDRTVTLQPNDTALLSYRVRATSAGGTSPIRLVVTDPDGVHTIATGNVVVRSAAASPVALTVASGALLFLSIWWIRDVRKRRRPARAGTSGAPSPVT